MDQPQRDAPPVRELVGVVQARGRVAALRRVVQPGVEGLSLQSFSSRAELLWFLWEEPIVIGGAAAEAEDAS